jgi:hypothetical protein
MPRDDDELRIELAWKVAAMEADTRLKNEQTRWEPWKVMATVFTATAALFGSIGVVIGYLLRGTIH